MMSQPLFHQRYLLLERVGKGGFSEVWHAKDSMTDMEVAIKILTKQDDQGILLCRNEYLSTYELSHPNIVIPFHFDVDESRPYLVMKYINGGTLSDRIGSMTKEAIDSIITQIGSALEYLHTLPEPVVHGDIKPDNILIDDSGKAYITDFGISFKMKQLLTQTMQSHYRENSFNGITPMAYRPPEFFKYRDWAIRPLSPKSDVWSFGVTLYHILFNQLPFNGEGGLGQLIMMKTGNHSLEDSLDFPEQSIFSGYYPLLSQCLQLNPEDRLRIIGPTAHTAVSAPPTYPFSAPVSYHAPEPIFIKEKKKDERKLLIYLIFFGVIAAGLIAYTLFSDRNRTMSKDYTSNGNPEIIVIDDDTLTRLGLQSTIEQPQELQSSQTLDRKQGNNDVTNPPANQPERSIQSVQTIPEPNLTKELQPTIIDDTMHRNTPKPVIITNTTPVRDNNPEPKSADESPSGIRTAIVRPNIRLPLVLQTEINSVDNYPPGTKIPFILREDVKSYDKVILTKGATVYAVVNKSNPKKITFSFEAPRTSGGTPLKKLNLNNFEIDIGKKNLGKVFMPVTSAYQKDVLINNLK